MRQLVARSRIRIRKDDEELRARFENAVELCQHARRVPRVLERVRREDGPELPVAEALERMHVTHLDPEAARRGPLRLPGRELHTDDVLEAEVAQGGKAHTIPARAVEDTEVARERFEGDPHEALEAALPAFHLLLVAEVVLQLQPHVRLVARDHVAGALRSTPELPRELSDETPPRHGAQSPPPWS